ncbi:sodium/proline symporter PutP [Arcanobacterium phocisimile]|uniref:Sodium/proline symporter n=1 Tax=Arcanobacterium phocisimile TaxID=1302235 RepID=A0ABX7IEE2_9ACTO|nr:sodium/proline symporter PutP [Arcanobacterium phocisimile]QRV01511.1 sodium/proline symporter PutP [Arcanobacterium phocisimile]
MSDQRFQILSMIIYLLAMITIGLWAYRKNSSVDDYILGGRQLHPAVAALSAGASDMSGWLLMGLPGALYANGLVESWIAIGLTVGAWLNWKFVAPRLRSYTEVSNNSITVPSFLDSRLRDSSHALRILSGFVILFFFTFYVSSGMVAGGTFFEAAFGFNYLTGMLLVAGVTILYTLLGGFLAVSLTDLVQGIMMLLALVMVPVIGLIVVGGPQQALQSAELVNPDLQSLTGGNGLPFTGIVAIISALAWGLGYFGQPHIIVRFMALRKPSEATSARRIGIGWMVLSILGAMGTALVGVAYAQQSGESILENPEQVFIYMGQVLFHPFIAGFMLAAILAAIMSTISSQLLVSSSALVEDIYSVFFHKAVSEKRGVLLSRLAVVTISVIAALLAISPSDTILQLVAFAWAGFGGAFGPIIILSLFWRKLTTSGALSGMLTGTVTVVLWSNLSGGIFDLYEIVPGFLVNLIVSVVISLFTYKPHKIIDAEFDAAAELAHDWSANHEVISRVRATASDDSYNHRSTRG